MGVGRSNSTAQKLSTLNAQLSTLSEDSGSAIFPLIVGNEQAALDLATALKSEGFLVPAIRYPTVARGSARLHITITASHEENQIRSLCETIKRLSEIA